MSNVELHPDIQREVRHEPMSHRMTIGGSAVETLLGLTAVVLSILALAGLMAAPLASIAVIAAGAALLFESAAISRATGTTGTESEGLIKGGIGADAVAGLAAVALGILSLIGIDPNTLLPVAAIVLGAGMLVASGAMSVERERAHRTAEEHELARTATATAGVRTLVGAGAVVLGILGLLGKSPTVLTLIAILSIGGGILLSGATFGGRLSTLLRHPA